MEHITVQDRNKIPFTFEGPDQGNQAVATLKDINTIVDEVNVLQAEIDGIVAGDQAAIQFQDEGVNLGTIGTVDLINFVGTGIAVSRIGNTITVNSSSTPPIWGNITGTVTDQTDLMTYLSTNYYDISNPAGYISGITGADVIAALGYTPYDDTNPAGYITGITSGDVTTALGYTPVAGSGTLNYIPKWTPDGVTLGNSVVFDDGTNTGFGTILPTARGHFKGVDATSGAYGLKVDDSANVTNFSIRNDGEVFSRLGYWIMDASSTSQKFISNTRGNDTNVIIGLSNATLHSLNPLTIGQVTVVGSQCGATWVGSASSPFTILGYNNLNNVTGGNGNMALGSGISFAVAGAYNHSIGIGTDVVLTASNQFVLGGAFSGVDHVYLGHGVANADAKVWAGTANFKSIQTGNAGLAAGDLYKDTAANIAANGDLVIGIKV